MARGVACQSAEWGPAASGEPTAETSPAGTSTWGRHRFETVPVDQFSVYVANGSAQSAHVLSTIRPGTLPTWNWDMPEGAGIYHGLFPYAWFEYDWDALP